MNRLLQAFPILVSPFHSSSYHHIGRTKDQWMGSASMSIKERAWKDLASVTIQVGRQRVSFYDASLESLRTKFDLAVRAARNPAEIESEATTKLVYNFAAPQVVSRHNVLQSEHPANKKYRNLIDAVFHDDNTISAAVSSIRPWHYMEMAFAPGFFDGISHYLKEAKIVESDPGR